MTPLVELRDVRVRVGRRPILDVPSLRLAAGETVAVLGRNGAGKSTLLRVVCALQRHEGAVLLRGLPAEPKLLRRATASVLQRPVLRRGTVRTNVETGLRFHGVDRATRRATGERWMAQLGIGHLAGLPAHALSGGEAQRTSLARALAVQPELLLLDEPLTGLDAPTRAELLADLRAVLARTHTAALVVTHDLHEAVALADRLLLLDAGRIRQEGPTRTVVDRPADRVCAELLGYENVIDGKLAARLLGRPGHVALRARDCTPEPVTQRDPRPGDLLLAGRLVHVLPHLERLTVVADVDGTALRTGSRVPTPSWLRTTRPGDPLGVRVRRDALRPLHAP